MLDSQGVDIEQPILFTEQSFVLFLFLKHDLLSVCSVPFLFLTFRTESGSLC